MLLRRYKQAAPVKEEKVTPEAPKQEQPAEQPKAKGTRKK